MDGDCSHEVKRCSLLGRKAMTNLDSILKSRGITLLTKGPYSQSYGFSRSHVWMWGLDHKDAEHQNWYFQTVMLEKTLEIPLDSKVIKPVNPKENQPWIFIRRTDAEAEAPILWSPDMKSRSLILEKIEGRRKRGWQRMQWLDRINHSMDLNLSKLQELADMRRLTCCSPWGCKESDMT